MSDYEGFIQAEDMTATLVEDTFIVTFSAAIGPDGQAGADGGQGPPGLAVSFQGTYSGAATYGLNHVVHHEGSFFISLQNGNTGNTPNPATDTTFWGRGSLRGATGAAGLDKTDGGPGIVGFAWRGVWDSDKQFAVDDISRWRAAEGRSLYSAWYRCNTAHTSGANDNPLADPDDRWDKIWQAEPGDPGADGRNGADGADGNDGAPGADGSDGAPGIDGTDGGQGPAGAAGLSALTIEVNEPGSTGFLASWDCTVVNIFKRDSGGEPVPEAAVTFKVNGNPVSIPFGVSEGEVVKYTVTGSPTWPVYISSRIEAD